jgi:hypothetical protein
MVVMMFAHPLFLLAMATFLVVIGLAGWNYISTRRRQKYGRDVKGMGGKNDPLR